VVDVVAGDAVGGASDRPYGTGAAARTPFPGLRFAPPWAIFICSLREQGRWYSPTRSCNCSIL
jgi:hypothetical protein